MKKFVFVREDNGECLNFVRVQTEYAYNTGNQGNGTICIEVSDDLSATEEDHYIRTKYYKDNEWHDREPSPSPSHLYRWENEEWVYDDSKLRKQIKDSRNLLLAFSDWSQMPDNGLTEEQKETWRVYRQELRDIPATTAEVTDYDAVVWPDTPS